jgi:2-desacetyl-2-hydroxyethyl bacteriochlorophyllide A dehydrogenase
MARAQQVMFSGRSSVSVLETVLDPPRAGAAVVRTRLSAISTGTEMKLYRGRLAEGTPTDINLAGLAGAVRYPMPYGYSTVGIVESVGRTEDLAWLGRRVFAFHPHADRFCLPIDELLLLPDDVSDDDAAFLPNMETAVSLIHDASPLVGECAVVVGLGVVGLLVTAILTRCGLATVIGYDTIPLRRLAAAAAGATAVYAPHERLWPEASERPVANAGADVAIEVSGQPTGLALALELTGFAGRIVVGSWYDAAEPASFFLGERFHRFKQTVISSQVSTVPPRLSGRWTKRRRLDTALAWLNIIRPARWITHRFSFEQAGDAYALLDAGAEATIQVVLTYPSTEPG